jgi:hypothetical protein
VLVGAFAIERRRATRSRRISGSNAIGTNPGAISWATELAPKGVVFVEFLDDGPVDGMAATRSDLQTWVSDHAITFSTGIDPGNRNLGIFFDADAVPLNIDIDARTMKVLDASVGLDTHLDETIESFL